MEQPKLIPAIGIMGGTFDPIHFGHLRTALELKQILNLDEIRLIPCKDPVHKERVHSLANDRLFMLQLAVANTPGLCVDDREINRQTPSYMVNTLQAIRNELPETPLCLIMGSDSFCNLPTWYRWQHILDLAHIIVVMRPGHPFTMDSTLEHLMEERQLDDPEGLQELPSGYIYVQTISALEIDATTIRSQVAAGYNPQFLLPEAVWEYIQQNRLYGLNKAN